jgi:DNA polymerase-3 subunit delta
VPETTVLIFVEKEVDKRNRAYKAAKEYGRAVEVTQPDQDKIVRWIGKRLKDNQKMMNRQALQLFLEMTGSGMENMDKELEKLLCYTLEQGEITAQDVEEICVKQTTKQIFEMIDALSQKKKKEALTLYYDLLALKEAPVLILYLITRQFRILWKIKEMQKKRIDTKTMASALGIPEFAVRKNMAQANRFDTAWLRNKVESCVAYEEAVKTGKLNDKMAVEMVICGE